MYLVSLKNYKNLLYFWGWGPQGKARLCGNKCTVVFPHAAYPTITTTHSCVLENPQEGFQLGSAASGKRAFPVPSLLMKLLVWAQRQKSAMGC